MHRVSYIVGVAKILTLSQQCVFSVLLNPLPFILTQSKMDKLALKAYLMETEHHLLEELSEEYESFRHGNAVQFEQDTNDPDDRSRMMQSNDDLEILNEQMENYAKHLNILQQLSFEPSTVVEAGAVVKINGMWILIAVSEGKFNFDNKQMIAISAQAPIFAAMVGKSVGEKFQFNNKPFTIEEIH